NISRLRKGMVLFRREPPGRSKLNAFFAKPAIDPLAKFVLYQELVGELCHLAAQGEVHGSLAEPGDEPGRWRRLVQQAGDLSDSGGSDFSQDPLYLARIGLIGYGDVDPDSHAP